MKFGQYISTTEALDKPPMNTDQIVQASEVSQDTDAQAAPPAGLDESNIADNPNASEVEQAVDVESSLDASEAEATEILDQPETVEQYLKASTRLDEIQQAAQEATQDGTSLTKLGALSIQTSMESILRSLGMTADPLPTLETFNSKWSKVKATQVTMESVYSTGKRLISKIIEALKAAAEIAINFLAGIFKNRKLLETRLQSLLNKVRDKKDYVPNEPTLHGRYSHVLQYGKTADMRSIYKMMQSCNQLIDGFSVGVSVIKDIRNDRSSTDPIAEVSKTLEASFSGTMTDIMVNDKDAPQEGYLALPNAMSILFIDGKIVYHTNQNGAPKKETMTAPTPVEIQSGLETAIRVIQNLQKVEATSNTLRDAIKGIVRRIETEYQVFRGAAGNEDYSKKARLNKEALATQEVINKMVARFPAMVFTAVKNVGDWASAGISNLKSA